MASATPVNTQRAPTTGGSKRRAAQRQVAVERDAIDGDAIKFIPSESFGDPNHVRELLEALPSIERIPPEITGGGGDDARSGNAPQPTLLNRDDERLLFLKMNGLRYLAELRRSRTSRLGCRDRDRNAISNLLAEANEIRAMIALCNQRLLKAIVRNLACHSLSREELLSEANLVLLRAIDRFDVDKGFRFSTYATHAIRRHLVRGLQREMRQRAKHWELESEPTVVDVDCEWLDVHPAELIAEFLSRLSLRDRQIVELRFGLAGRKRGMTFRAIAACLDISAERARQIVNEHCRRARSRYAAELGITFEGN